MQREADTALELETTAEREVVLPPVFPIVAAGEKTERWRHSTVGLGLGAFFVAAITLGLNVLNQATGPDFRPFTIFYLIAVATIAGGWGLRVGLLTALFCIVTAGICLMAPRFLLPEWRLRAVIEMLGLILGSITVAVVAGRLHDVLASLRDAVAARQEVEERQGTFFRDVVAAVTHGRLVIVGREEMRREIAASARAAAAAGQAHDVRPISIEGTEDIGKVRHAARERACALGFCDERVSALELCIGEATTNALKHGGGGYTRLLPPLSSGYPGEPGLRVLVADRGPGMSTILLPHLALWRGYSTQNSMGMGFSVMIDLADRVLLCTDAGGTLVLIEMSGGSTPDEEDIDAILANFPSL